MQQRILVVDDDRSICEILAFNLKNDGFEVICAHSAEEALPLTTSPFDLILLDVMMGGMSGYQMAESLRRNNINIPVIFLTAKDSENDMLTGFAAGGDDYISKPFSIKEVLARIKAVLRRTASTSPLSNLSPESELTFGALFINTDTKEVRVHGEPIDLTKTETELLIFLVRNHERVLSRAEIIQNVWRETPFITERTVDVHVTRLRKKLLSCSAFITNRSGYGYRFNTEALCD